MLNNTYASLQRLELYLCLSNSTCVCPGFAPLDLRPYRHCLTTRGVVTTEDIDAELVSREPLLLVPEELSISTILAKEKLAPMLKAANLPSLEVTPSQLSMGNLLSDVLTSTCHAWPAFNLSDIKSLCKMICKMTHFAVYATHLVKDVMNMLALMQPSVAEELTHCFPMKLFSWHCLKCAE